MHLFDLADSDHALWPPGVTEALAPSRSTQRWADEAIGASPAEVLRNSSEQNRRSVHRTLRDGQSGQSPAEEHEVMTHIAFTSRSIRTTVGAVSLAVAATLALGACSSQSESDLTPISSTPTSSAGDQAPAAAPKPSAEKVEKTEQSAPDQVPVAAHTTSARSVGKAPETSNLKYKKIVEPFGKPGRCDPAGNTVEMTACILKQVVAVDHTVDVLQAQKFQYGTSPTEAEDDLRDDANWLAKRTKTCSTKGTGGSIDQITAAQCLLRAGKARVKSLS
jgi:uncharacterized protein YecT (DUF1311 family)